MTKSIITTNSLLGMRKPDCHFQPQDKASWHRSQRNCAESRLSLDQSGKGTDEQLCNHRCANSLLQSTTALFLASLIQYPYSHQLQPRPVVGRGLLMDNTDVRAMRPLIEKRSITARGEYLDRWMFSLVDLFASIQSLLHHIDFQRNTDKFFVGR